MEFTLPQLTPGNLKLIFQAAAYDVVECVEHEMKDGHIEKHGLIVIKENERSWVIQPLNDFDSIKFIYSFWITKEQAGDTKEIVFLKVSNSFDGMPVHGTYRGGPDEDGEHCFEFINSAIFPDGEAVDSKKIIKVFRLFQKQAKINMNLFDDVLEKARDNYA